MKRFDRVKKKVEHTFWDGRVLGFVYRLNGQKLVVCERPDCMLFMALPHELEIIQVYTPGDETCVVTNARIVEGTSQNPT